jgi:hypothetical protein
MRNAMSNCSDKNNSALKLDSADYAALSVFSNKPNDSLIVATKKKDRIK